MTIVTNTNKQIDELNEKFRTENSRQKLKEEVVNLERKRKILN